MHYKLLVALTDFTSQIYTCDGDSVDLPSYSDGIDDRCYSSEFLTRLAEEMEPFDQATLYPTPISEA